MWDLSRCYDAHCFARFGPFDFRYIIIYAKAIHKYMVDEARRLLKRGKLDTKEVDFAAFEIGRDLKAIVDVLSL